MDLNKHADEIFNILNEISSTQPEHYDDPNSGYESKCPFCYNYVNTSSYVGMNDIHHDDEICTWIKVNNLIKKL